MVAAPNRLPSSAPVSSTANVCPVIGTGVNGSGMAIFAISAVKRLNPMTNPMSVSSVRCGIHVRTSVVDVARPCIVSLPWNVFQKIIEEGLAGRASGLSGRSGGDQRHVAFVQRGRLQGPTFLGRRQDLVLMQPDPPHA